MNSEFDVKSVCYYVFLVLLWLIMMLFAYDFMVARLTQNSQIKQQSIVTGQYQFSIPTLQHKHVVSSFRQDWKETEQGLLAINNKPEISIDLTGFKLWPQLHRSLKIGVKNSGFPSGRLGIELSNQIDQIYYQSEPIQLNQLSSHIDLSQIKWQRKQPEQKPQPVSWETMGLIDALVLRFYDVDAQRLQISQLEIVQTDSGVLAFEDSVCADSVQISCMLTNTMSHNAQNPSVGDVFLVQKYQQLSTYSASIWLLAAWLTAMFLLKLSVAKKLWLYVLMSLLFLTVFAVHQNWIIELTDVLRWIFLCSFAALLWWQRAVFLLPKNPAVWIWLGTLILAGVLFLMSPTIDFIYRLPSYLLWALFQQLLVGPVFSHMIFKETECTKWQVAWLVGILFSILHAPNHMLMLATLLGGVLWSYSWLKYQNIYANACSHAVLALLFYQVIPDQWLGSARIGVFF